MALTYGFYNSINHDRKYDAIQFGQIFDGLILDGVYRSYKSALMAKESNQDNQVIIQPGRAWFDHTWSYNDSDLVVSMPSPEVFLDRIDAIVLDINRQSNVRANTIKVVQGEPSDEPQKPTLITTDTNTQHPLCFVYRHGGQNHIGAADIENAVGVDPRTPFVIGVIEGITIDELMTQYSYQFVNYMAKKATQWNSFQAGMTREIEVYEDLMEKRFFEWMETQKVKYREFIDHNALAWNNWFENVQYELDGDVAGHLQTQIDQIKKFASIYVVDSVLYVPMSGATVNGKKLIFATI